MFSNNGKISDHQAIRLLIMDVFTGGCLFLPMALPRVCGNSGVMALILGFVLTMAEGVVISKCLVQSSKPYISTLGYGLRVLYAVRCFAVFVFLMGMFIAVLNETFLYAMPKVMILIGMTLILVYGTVKGVEVRARLSEIFFYIALVPIVLIGLFSLPEADWGQLFVGTDLSLTGVFWGSLVTWVLMAPVEWLLYIDVSGSFQNPFKIFSWAIGIGGILILLIYILCVTVLSVPGMAAERWPTVILMQIVRIPGGFLSRQDGLMLSFWIFAMFISLSGALSHASDLLWRDRETSKKWCVLLLAFFGSAAAFYLGMNRKFLNMYFSAMIISGMILLGILFLFICVHRCKKITAAVILMVLSAGLMGCESYTELENRAFIMALGVDEGENENFRFTYTFPDVSALTGQDGGLKQKPLTLEVGSLKAGEDIYNHMSDKTMDYGQVKVLMISDSIISNEEKMEKLMEEIKNKPEFARTVRVCMSKESAERILNMDEEVSGSIGIYLENMLEQNESRYILNDCIFDCDYKQMPVIKEYMSMPFLEE